MIEYFLSDIEREQCGLIINNKFHPVTNISDDPNSFVMHPQEFISVILEHGENIQAVIHSHLEDDLSFSEVDKKASDFLDIPYIIVGIPSGELRTYYKGVETEGEFYK